ncbi:MAG: hypothetical protein ACRBG0_04790 [Lewinella sp.]|uniref:hypothetical protein n=1 Tax=Lewinella sp. TaxID=2004506 RepID=UPI003D6B348A
MNRRHLLLLLVIISCVPFSCGEDDEASFPSDFGAIYVTVKQDNTLIQGATITTLPITDVFNTDFSGSAILRDLPPEIYEVTATHPDYGTGKGAVAVNRGIVTEVDIELIPGIFPNPIINITSPLNGTEHDLEFPINFQASVSDDEDPVQTLTIEWRSNIDGVFSTIQPNSSGVIEASYSSLSEGDHQIQVIATDSEGNIGSATVNISVRDLPDSVILLPLEGINTGFVLNWSAYSEVNFDRYIVYRSQNPADNFSPIASINDINTTSYSDAGLIDGNTYYYRIGVKLSTNEEPLSNIQGALFQSPSIFIPNQIERMKADPNRPYLYALDRINNALMFISTTSLDITKTIFVGSSPTDLAISLDGDALFIANFGSTQIIVVDLETQEIDYDFFVNTNIGTWDGNPYRLAPLSNNRMAFTSEDQWNNIKVVNATTGVNVSTSSQSIYEPGLLSTADGTVLYAAERGSTGSSIIRYNFNGSTLQQVDQSDNSTNFGTRDAFLTANEQYLFYNGKKILANNLQSTLGTFGGHIYGINSDGSLVFGEEQYYDGNTFAIKGTMPAESRVMAMAPDDSVLYLYDIMSSRIILFVPD